MYCYQCEQTAKGIACTNLGVCGKDHPTAVLQDLLVYATKGIAMYAHRAAALGARDETVDKTVLEALFATVTNVDFDPQRSSAILPRRPPPATGPNRSMKPPAPRPASSRRSWRARPCGSRLPIWPA